MSTWLPVVGWEGLYEVSDDGAVRSLPRLHNPVGRVIKTSRNPKQYHIVVLSGLGRRVAYPLHRLVAEAFIGPRPEGMHTCHGDGDKDNNTAANLAYKTPSANELDKVAHGLNPNALKTHCPQNHPYDEANTLVRNGTRICRACKRERKRAYDAARRAAASLAESMLTTPAPAAWSP